MAEILAVGIATLDIIHEVGTYPVADTETRALAQHVMRGGNATNTLVVLSQLGHHCCWAGSLADDSASQIILADLQQYQIDVQYCQHYSTYASPLSVILLPRDSATRTISHYRDLPEYPLEAFMQLPLARFDWLHVEGRDVQTLHTMLQHADRHYPDLPVSLELEKPRAGIEALIPCADVVMCSRDYAMAKGYSDMRECVSSLQQEYPETLFTCTWGEAGAAAQGVDAGLYTAAVDASAAIIDTRAAGDVFNAAMIDALCRQATLPQALQSAVALATHKCTRVGLHGLV